MAKLVFVDEKIIDLDQIIATERHYNSPGYGQDEPGFMGLKLYTAGGGNSNYILVGTHGNPQSLGEAEALWNYLKGEAVSVAELTAAKDAKFGKPQG